MRTTSEVPYDALFKWMKRRNRIVFDDGVVVSVENRHALRITRSDLTYLIDFEETREKTVDRLIFHSALYRVVQGAERIPVVDDERDKLIAYVEEFCRRQDLTYRIVP